jgi:hypothetical protein
MKARLFLSLAIGGLILASLMWMNTGAAYAGCNGPNDPNPCPEPGEKEKKQTAIPATDTPQACTETTWYWDADADGYGAPGGKTASACAAPAGYGAKPGDCNDANSAIHPGAEDFCGDGIDQNCDGADAVCAVAAPAPVTGACVGPDCATGSSGGGGTPWLFGAGGVVLGILIGLLLPFKLGSFFDRGGGGVFRTSPGGGPHVASSDNPAGFDVFTPNPAGGGGTDPAGSFFDSTVGKGTPGGGDTDPAGSFFDSQPGGGSNPAGFDTDMSNPAGGGTNPAGGSPKSGFDTDM